MPYDTLAAILFKFAFMVFLGYLFCKLGLIDADFKQKLSALLIKAILPLHILAGANGYRPPGIGKNLLGAAVGAAAYYVLTFGLLVLLSRKRPQPAEKRSVFVNLSVFANTGFMGFPLSYALFGEEGLIYAVIYNLVFQLALFTVGVKLLGSSEKTRWRTLLLDPATLASVASILLYLSPWRLPGPLASAVADVGAISMPVSMFIIGCGLVGTRFTELWSDGWSYLASALRLVVFPFAMLGAVYLLGLRGTLPAVLVLVTALPPASMNVVLAEQHGADSAFATRAVVQAMVWMLFTLPLVLWGVNALLLA